MSLRMLIGFALLCAGLISSEAHAQNRRALAPPARKVPAPFAVPDLSHGKIDARLDGMVGWLDPQVPNRGDSVVSLTRLSLEGSVLAPRRLYLGLSYPYASALPPDGGLALGEVGASSGMKAMLGNLEAQVRSVFRLPDDLEIGFLLGVVAPTASFGRQRDYRSAYLAAASLDPTNVLHFSPGRVGLRPAGDVRVIKGPFIFQARHGVDFLLDDQGLDTQVAGRMIGHIGWCPFPQLELSGEFTQHYFFGSDQTIANPTTPNEGFNETYRVTDGTRSAVTLAPGIRYATRDLDIGVQMITSVRNVLSPVTDEFYAISASVIGHFGAPRP